MSSAQKVQLIWAAGWLADRGYSIGKALGGQWIHEGAPGQYRTFSDDELLAYAIDKGIKIPIELKGWTPVEQMPEEWEDARDLLISWDVNGLDVVGEAWYRKVTNEWVLPGFDSSEEERVKTTSVTHVRLMPTGPRDGGLE
jgi:hypothetical protein